MVINSLKKNFIILGCFLKYMYLIFFEKWIALNILLKNLFFCTDLHCSF